MLVKPNLLACTTSVTCSKPMLSLLFLIFLGGAIAIVFVTKDLMLYIATKSVCLHMCFCGINLQIMILFT